MIVGQYTARFIDYLVSRGMHLPSLHLAGLSLGAQMAGVCGQYVKSGRISRITGLYTIFFKMMQYDWKLVKNSPFLLFLWKYL